MKKKLKICLFPAIMLPVPAVMGGAVEGLLNTIINQNEIYNFFDLTVVSIFNIEAENISKNFKHTKFIFIREKWIYKYLFFIYRIIRKITSYQINILSLNRLNYNAIKKIKKNNYDYIICEGGEYHDFYKLTKYFGIKKMIVHLHSEFESDELIGNTFSKAIAISNFIKDRWLEQSFNENMSVKILFNCIDLNLFNKVDNKSLEKLKKKYNCKNYFLYLYVGRIIPEKGVYELVKSFNMNTQMNSKLMIIGSPNFGKKVNSNYLKLIKKIVDMDNRIIWNGYIDNNKLPLYYHLADCVIMPTLCNEAAGLVAIEALAAGRNLVVTNSGGLPEYVNEYAKIISKENIENELKSIFCNEHIIIIDKSGLNKYLEQYDIPNYYQNFHKVMMEFVEEDGK